MIRRTLIRMALATAVATGLVAQAHITAHAAPGDIDTTFGSGGMTEEYIGRTVNIVKLMIQPDNKILVAGWADYPPIVIGGQTVRRIFLRRYSASGALEPGFPLLPIGEAYNAEVQADGKIVVVGKSPRTFTILGHQYNTVAPTVWRFTSTGQLDPTFDADGEKVLGTLNGAVKDVELLGSRIYVGFISRPVPGLNPLKYKISRLSTTGSTEGTITQPLRSVASLDISADSPAMNVSDANGDIAVVGLDETTEDRLVLLYTKDGLPVASFGTNGKVSLPVCNPVYGPLQMSDVLVQPDGKVFVFGYEQTNPGFVGKLHGLLANGNSDFCHIRAAILPFHRLLLRQPDAQVMFSAGGAYFRYTADGTPDITFSTQGSNAAFNSRAVQPDMKLVGVTRALYYPNGDEYIRVYRYLLN